MKEYSMETPGRPETSEERLVNKVDALFNQLGDAIAVEVYGHGIGRPDEDTVTEKQLQAESAEVRERYREDFLDLLDGSSMQQEVLKLYDDYGLGLLSLDEIQEEIKKTILSSREHAAKIEEHTQTTNEEFERVAAELPGFLDAKIVASQGNRVIMSKWGNAKLAYAKGDSAGLKVIMAEYADSIDEQSEKEQVESFLRFLEHQRFAS